MSSEQGNDFHIGDDAFFGRLHSLVGGETARVNAAIRLMVVCVTVGFVPLALFSAMHGTLWNGVGSLLYDIDLLVRLLISLPLLILVIVPINRQLQTVIRYFVDSGIVPAECHDDYLAVLRRTEARRNSIIGWILTLGVAYGVTLYARDVNATSTFSVGWFNVNGIAGGETTLAGWWFTFVSAPLINIFVLRWLWLIVTWNQMLRAVARMPIQLVPSHPDLMGGLGYVAREQGVYGFVALAISTLAAGRVASDILFAGGHVLTWAPAMITVTAILLILVLYPMIFFAGPLGAHRRTLLLRYGATSAHVSRNLELFIATSDKEVTPEEARDQIFSSHTDMTSSFQNAEKMTGLPFSKSAVIQLVGMAALPFIPVIGIEYDLVELLKQAMVLL
jgi:hypothetical protein